MKAILSESIDVKSNLESLGVSMTIGGDILVLILLKNISDGMRMNVTTLCLSSTTIGVLQPTTT